LRGELERIWTTVIVSGNNEDDDVGVVFVGTKNEVTAVLGGSLPRMEMSEGDGAGWWAGGSAVWVVVWW
jgi:hypothetical protein